MPDSSETRFSAVTSCDLMESREGQNATAMWEKIQSMMPAQKDEEFREAKVPSGPWLWRLLFMKTHKLTSIVQICSNARQSCDWEEHEIEHDGTSSNLHGHSGNNRKAAAKLKQGGQVFRKSYHHKANEDSSSMMYS